MHKQYIQSCSLYKSSDLLQYFSMILRDLIYKSWYFKSLKLALKDRSILQNL